MNKRIIFDYIWIRQETGEITGQGHDSPNWNWDQWLNGIADSVYTGYNKGYTFYFVIKEEKNA